MLQKSEYRTLLALFVWLFLENFNLRPSEGVQKYPLQGVNSTYSKAKGTLMLPSSGVIAPSDYKIKKVVLDAGHGGKDPGCIGVKKTYEKSTTLAVVLALGARISAAYPDVEVIYTRSTDVFIELNERAGIANRNNADLFISVHCNAMSAASASGTETYVMGLHTAKHNLEVAKRENASIYLEDDYKKNYEGYDPDSPEAHILGSVWQSAYLEQSILLASHVQTYTNAIASRDDRGVKQAGFLVLRETAMPSVLVECGYLTNAAEEAYLSSDEGRDQMAESIFSAFQAYKLQLEEGTIVQKPEPAPKKKQPKTNTLPQKQPETAVATNKEKAPPIQPASKPSPVVTGTKQPVNSKPKATEWPQNKEKAPVKATPVATDSKKTTTPQTTDKKEYRIHLMNWPSRLDPNAGKLALLNNVLEEKTPTEYQYFIGNFASRDEAEKMLSEIKNMGFKTATLQEKTRN